jgi:hypothetical protein
MRPQPPQFAGFEPVSTQLRPHSVVPDGQISTQAPELQTSLAPHEVAHVPQ